MDVDPSNIFFLGLAGVTLQAVRGPHVSRHIQIHIHIWNYIWTQYISVITGSQTHFVFETDNVG